MPPERDRSEASRRTNKGKAPGGRQSCRWGLSTAFPTNATLGSALVTLWGAEIKSSRRGCLWLSTSVREIKIESKRIWSIETQWRLISGVEEMKKRSRVLGKVGSTGKGVGKVRLKGGIR